MKLRYISAAALAALMIGTGGGWAQEDALKTLEGMHMTAPIEWPTVPQTGPESRRRQADPREDQAAAGIPH